VHGELEIARQRALAKTDGQIRNAEREIAFHGAGGDIDVRIQHAHACAVTQRHALRQRDQCAERARIGNDGTVGHFDNVNNLLTIAGSGGYVVLHHDNTGGILVFDLPGLQQEGGHGIRVYANKMQNNNVENFAASGDIVGLVPAGTGFFVMANHDVEVFGNTITGNVMLGNAEHDAHDDSVGTATAGTATTWTTHFCQTERRPGLFDPHASGDEIAACTRMQRAAATAEAASIFLELDLYADLRHVLGNVPVPALVLHRRGDRTVPIGRGRELASLLPHARFVPLSGDSHLPWKDDQRELSRALAGFLHNDAVPELDGASPLSSRETEILRLVATGMSNREIARTLVLSEHTVHRHVANILRKLAQSTRAAAATQAARAGII